MSQAFYKQAFNRAIVFAEHHGIDFATNEDGKRFFAWKQNGKRYVLGTKSCEKPDGNFIYYNLGLEKLPQVYTYNEAKDEVSMYGDDILREYFNEVYDNHYVKLFPYLKSKLLEANIKDIGTNELLYYFQNKFDIKTKFPFYEVNETKVQKLHQYLEATKSITKENVRFSNLVFEVYNKIYQDNLFSKNGKDAISYLNNRGISNEEIVKQGFGLGISGDVLENESLKKIRQLIAESLPLEDQEPFEKWAHRHEAWCPSIEYGLLNQTSRGRFDAMQNRITLPIRDKNGNLIAFGGRIINSFANPNDPKYVITKNSFVWSKSEHVFGYIDAKNNLAKNDTLMVVEGFMDALALNKIGIPAVALMGVNCSREQARLIKSLNSPKTIVSLDFDVAGENNNQKVCSILESFKVENISQFNKTNEIEAKDFDEFINQKQKYLDIEQKKRIIFKSTYLETPICIKKNESFDKLEVGE